MPDRKTEDHSQSTGDMAADLLARTQAECQSLRRELDHASRLSTLGVLAAGIAHEINNILTPVLAYAQLASSNPDDPELREKSISKTIQGVQNVTQIAQAMLGFSSQGGNSEAADIHQTIRDSLDCIARDPAKDRIQITVRVDPPGASVRMRPLALQQVLINLILNAKAVLQGRGGRISITATERHDGTSIIQVADTGPGIDREVIGKLFQPFVSTGRPSEKQENVRQGGSGLGLAICRRLVEEAQGSITAHSVANAGTTFTIILPTATASRSKAI